MDSSLFQLISIAGKLSLDEMRARGFGNVLRLAHELGGMVRSGNVALSFPVEQPNPVEEPELIFRPDDTALISELKSLTNKKRQDIDTESLEKILLGILENPEIASEITVSPTPLGYKSSIS